MSITKSLLEKVLLDAEENRFSEQQRKSFHEELGQYVVIYSQFESMLASFAKDLIGEDRILGSIIISETSFKNIIAKIRCLYEHRCPNNPEYKELKDLLDKAMDIEEYRNNLLHSAIMHLRTNEVLRTKSTAKYKQGYRHTIGTISIDELKKNSNVLAETTIEIIKFHNKYMKDKNEKT
jgi:hypothetical protein